MVLQKKKKNYVGSNNSNQMLRTFFLGLVRAKLVFYIIFSIIHIHTLTQWFLAIEYFKKIYNAVYTKFKLINDIATKMSNTLFRLTVS